MDVVSAVLSRGGRSFLSAYWKHASWCSLRCCWPPLPQGALLAHVQPFVHQDPPVLLCKAGFQLLPREYWKVQDFSFPSAVINKVSVCPFAQLASPSEWQHGHLVYQPLLQIFYHLQLAEGALCPFIQVINKDVKQCWPKYWPFGYSTTDWPPAGFVPAHLTHQAQTVLSSHHCPFIWFVFQHFAYEDAIAKVKINIIAFPSSTESSYCRRLSD